MTIRQRISDAEWQARLDLAACYRLVARYGMADLIYNHITVRVPGEAGHILINPFGYLYEEITASCLYKIDLAGNVVDKPGDVPYEVNQAGYVIHSAIHSARHDIACVLHTHMPYATALTLTQDRALDTRLSQNAMRFHGRLAADPDYNGLALDHGEGERIARAMGGAEVCFLGNHGVIVCGARIDHAYDDLYYLERACMTQVLAASTGRPLAPVADELAASVAAQTLGERLQSELFFEALRRQL